MSPQKSQPKRVLSTLAVSALVLGGVAFAPVTVVFPTQAHAVENSIASAREAGSEMAVTEHELEEVLAPTGYSEAGELTAQEVLEQREELEPHGTPPTQTTEELSLARALISSETTIIGVTFPRENADENVQVSYRQRIGDQWSEWLPLELATPSLDAIKAGTAVQGTEPIPLVGIDEVEAQATTANGESIPGVVLTTIEPELTPEELHDAQTQKHGADEIRAAQSILPDAEYTTSTPTQTPQKHPEPTPQYAENTTPDPNTENPNTTETPAEKAEEEAELPIPNTGTGTHTLGQGIVPVRATGFTADGNAYVTDIPGLTITTRKGWGADESNMDWDPEPITIKGAVIHHTAGSNNYSKAQVPGVVRGIYHYHAVTLGWGDVGYHLLVDKFGGVWEGRAGGITKAVEGGHAYGANNATFGISVLGDYMHVRPSDEAIEAVSKAVAWKLRIHNIRDINGTINVKGNQWGKKSINIPIIAAHRDVGGTTCPGDAFMKSMPEIKTKVAKYLADTGNTNPPSETKRTENFGQRRAQWGPKLHMGTYWHTGTALYGGAMSAPGNTDALLIDRRGDFWLYPAKNHGKPGPRWNIGNSWTNLDQITSGLDFDGDRIPDVVGRLKRNGDLLLYPGDGKGKLKPARKIGSGWGGFTSIRAVGGMIDKHPAVYAVDRTGTMRVYRTDGKGNFTTNERLGTGWGTMRGFVAVGDKSGNGKVDMLVVDAKGDVWVYEGNGKGSFYDRVKVASGWSFYEQVLSAGEDGHIWTVSDGGYFTSHQLIALR